ncbi:adenosylcobinamide-phosphate synthase CbiB [Nocardioides sp. Bht2]|uniref:adenosylcobinamide-phosphate synthase CbiB n=1 Tax=Nocardioides sp. Bht2 TaxID=3392297 RepID=UPI0039B52EBD
MTLAVNAGARGIGLVLGFVADRLLGDPRRGHPVALFGTAARRLEHRIHADDRGVGVGYTATLVGSVVVTGVALEYGCRTPWQRAALTALATFTVLGGRTLEREATAVYDHLVGDDLEAARQRLTHLVSRDTHELSEAEVARAVVESVAENTSDAVVAPLVWGTVAGVPGLLGYRAVNTLDAMVGYRNVRYRNFGWASARLDDLANLPGARLTALCVLAAAPRRARQSLTAWFRDAAAHPSPNAGVVEASFAGALGVSLGGRNTYRTDAADAADAQVEDRAVLGLGPAPSADTIRRTVRLARRVDRVAIAAAGVGLLGLQVLRTRR